MRKVDALALLRQMFGPGTEFRDGQWEAIDLAANQRKRLLVVQRTGWGKSIVYFLAARILRQAGSGPTLVVSPLLALMRNQLLAAERLGLRAVTINSQNVDEWEKVEEAISMNEVDLLLISPERLGNAEFLNRLLPLVRRGLGLFVVDEAHCISDWGHDLRPDYRRIVRVLKQLPPSVPVLCTTATANNRVVRDIEEQIANLTVIRGPLVRQSLKLFNIKLDDQAQRLGWLAHFLPQLAGSGIIYTLTVQDSRRVAAWLQQRGIEAQPYHADLEAAERVRAEQRLLANQVKALVATVALGMGFDKPDLGFVIHFQRPGSVVSYYQQVGRAGRAVDSAYGILLSGREDDEIQEYFIRNAFPPPEVLDDVLKLLRKSDGLNIDDLTGRMNCSYGTIERALKLLEVDGAVSREGKTYFRTANPWLTHTRSEEITGHRQQELAQIRSYVDHGGCLMEFLSRALDDPSAGPCGKCMNCTGKTGRRNVPQELILAAVDFLRNDSLEIGPRKLWPRAVLDDVQKTIPWAIERFENGRAKLIIPEHLRAREGRALCLYGDAGWGAEVAHGKYGSGRFSDALIEAAAALIRSRWKPNPAPEWVTGIPSRRHPELVRDFGDRLAAKLGLPFFPVLGKRGDKPPQKEMQNSAMQLRNSLGALKVVELNRAAGSTAPALSILDSANRLIKNVTHTITASFGPPAVVHPGPVLLVDDMVDSGWTMTLSALLLQHHGSGPVYPFVLARASLRGS
jgi:ATP-dependent DNA helicase RecQ